MTRTDIELLFEYDRWANKRVFDAVATLSAERFPGICAAFARCATPLCVLLRPASGAGLPTGKRRRPALPGLMELWNRCDALYFCVTTRSDGHRHAAQKWTEVEREQIEF